MKILKALIGILAVAGIVTLMLTYSALAEEPAVEECESVYDSILPVKFCQSMMSLGMAQADIANEVINDPMVQYQIFTQCQEQWANFLSQVYLMEMEAVDGP